MGEKTNLAENTILVFTGDHGDMLCEKGMVQKRSFYEWLSQAETAGRLLNGLIASTERRR